MPAGTQPKGEGKAIIFSAPSGAGKSTMIESLMSSDLPLGFSVSATTRAPRGEEVDGVSYHFMTPEHFAQKVQAGEFVEYEEVYEGLSYGTLCSEVEKMWAEGVVPLFDIDVVGGQTLKKVFGNSALSIFVVPPSIEELERRLRSRGTDDEKMIQKRVAKAAQELETQDDFDVKLVNENLDAAKAEAYRLVEEFIG